MNKAIPISIAAIVAIVAFSFPYFGEFAESQVSSPRQQMDSGINASDVTCKSGYVLMIRSGNGAAACVSPSTGSILEDRGWGTVESEPFAETETSERVSIEINERIGISSEPEN